MIHLDKNHLGHNFEIDNDNYNYHYLCKICGTKIKYILANDESDYIVRTIIETDFPLTGKAIDQIGEYYFNNLIFIGDILTLTCEEVIIKRIIE